MTTFPSAKPPRFRLDMVGRKVVCAKRDADGAGIELEGGWKIAIWAQFEIRDGSGATFPVESLCGARLEMFVGTNEAERLVFDTGAEVSVHLLVEDVEQNERMAVFGPDNVTVVWQ